MHTVTDEFHAACSAPGREVTSKINFNGTTDLPASEIQEIVVTEQFGSSDGVTIGAAFSSSCKVTMYKQDNLPLNGAYFIPSVGIMVNGEAQYVQKGKYYIPTDGVDESGKLWVTVTGYDRMASLTDDYVPTIDFPATPVQILTDVCTQGNVTAPSVALPDIQISAPYTGSLRQQLGWLAGLIGCNAKFGSNGELKFCWYSDSISVGPEVQYQGGLSKSADSPFTIQSLVTGTEEHPITVGTGVGISATNPYITEAVAATVFERIGNKAMMPCKVQWRGDPSTEAGDILHVTDVTGPASTFPVYIMEQELRIKGGMVANTTCYAPQDKQYVVESPIIQQVKREYSGLARAMQDATERIIGAKGGYWEVTLDDDGFPTGWMVRDTPTMEDNTRLWIMNINGLGYSKDGGKTISGVALTMDGAVNADTITAGQMSAERVTINGQTLSDFIDASIDENGHPVLRIGSSASEIVLKEYNDKIGFYDASGTLLAYWNNNSFELVELSKFRLGPMSIVVQPNQSISFVGVT